MNTMLYRISFLSLVMLTSSMQNANMKMPVKTVEKLISEHDIAFTLSECKDADALYAYGLIYASQGEESIAEQFLKKAIEKGSLEALVRLGVMYHEQDKLDLAEQHLKEAADKENMNGIYFLGILYAEQRKYDIAEQYLKKIVDNDESGKVHHVLGIIYEKQGKVDLAITFYKQAIAQDSIEAAYDLANFYNILEKIALEKQSKK